MHVNSQTQAVLLLTVPLGRSREAKVKPLTGSEWSRFARWLKAHDLTPASLFGGNLETLLSGWIDKSVDVARIQQLMGRGAGLGLALEKWQRAGIWPLTRADPEYPERLKERLGWESPAVLFGCGTRKLLRDRGIAVVGSRNASEEELHLAQLLGRETASLEPPVNVVSGGARGVDRAAMLGVLEQGGTAVGVLADSLIKAATSTMYRDWIIAERLLLLTPFRPDAGFNVGNAMSRNKYIYCLADAAAVVSSASRKGGTWNGACENLKHGWVPLWVNRNGGEDRGNHELVHRGARWLPEGPERLPALLAGLVPSPRTERSPETPQPEGQAVRRTGEHSDDVTVESIESTRHDQAVTSGEELFEGLSSSGNPNFYSLFLDWMRRSADSAPKSRASIAKDLNLHQPQVRAWLRRGLKEGTIVEAPEQPEMYEPAASSQRTLFPTGQDR